MESPGVSRIRREMAAFAAGEAPESEAAPGSEAQPAAAIGEEPVAAETEWEPVGASEVVTEVEEGECVVTEPVVASETMEREAPVENAAEEPRGWFSSLFGARREGGAEPGEATVGEGGGVLPGGPWAESAVDPRVTEEEGGVMRLEAKLRAHDGSLKDASVKFKPGERFYNWDGRFKKKKKKSPPPEELYTGPRDDGLLSTDEISGDYFRPGCVGDTYCNSMTVVPLGADTIEMSRSGCILLPPFVCIEKFSTAEVTTRKPGTNEFDGVQRVCSNSPVHKITFSADGTFKQDDDVYHKRPNSQKRAFHKVETRDLAGNWWGCFYQSVWPLWPLSACYCTRKTALNEDQYEESGRCCLCLPIPISRTHTRVYVNGLPTNGFHLESGAPAGPTNEFHWYRNPGWAMDESDPMATFCAKKIS
jgi:hypothetical protein